MRIQKYPDAPAFLRANRAHLLLRESEYNLKLGLAASIAEGTRTANTEGGDALFLSVETDAGDIIGVALRSSADRSVILSHMETPALELIVDDLAAAGVRARGVFGPTDTANSFVSLWSTATGCGSRLEMSQLVYEARSIALPDSEGGKLVIGGEREQDIAVDWVLAFATECWPTEPNTREGARKVSQRLLPKRHLVFWRSREGELVSMAAKNRETPNGASVSLVYTPPAYRRQGYAGRVVGALSQRILESGKSRCTLHTDASNPTSNAVYTRLGYRVVGKCTDWRFHEPAVEH